MPILTFWENFHCRWLKSYEGSTNHTSVITQSFDSTGVPLDVDGNPQRVNQSFMLVQNATDQLTGMIISVVASENSLMLGYTVEGTIGGVIHLSGPGTTTFTNIGSGSIEIEIDSDLSGVDDEGTHWRAVLHSVGTLTQ